MIHYHAVISNHAQYSYMNAHQTKQCKVTLENNCDTVCNTICTRWIVLKAVSLICPIKIINTVEKPVRCIEIKQLHRGVKKVPDFAKVKVLLHWQKMYLN